MYVLLYCINSTIPPQVGILFHKKLSNTDKKNSRIYVNIGGPFKFGLYENLENLNFLVSNPAIPCYILHHTMKVTEGQSFFASMDKFTYTADSRCVNVLFCCFV